MSINDNDHHACMATRGRRPAYRLCAIFALCIVTGACASTDGLSLHLSVQDTEAGQSIRYTAQLSNGWDTIDIQLPVTSDLEPDIESDGTQLTPTVAGTHTLRATLDHQGYTLTAEAALDVIPGPAHAVDLVLEQNAFIAGQTTSFVARVLDQYGNQLDNSPMPSAHVDRGDMTIDGTTLTATRAGDYVVTLELGGSIDAETVTVRPAAPVSIALTLYPFEVTPSAEANVRMLDIYENGANAPWTLTAQGPGGYAVDGSQINFLEDGIYTVTATIDGTDISDSYGPFLVDYTGPLIQIELPERATWTTGYDNVVSGQFTDAWSLIGSVTLQDAPVTLAADNTFSETVSCERGVNLVLTSAYDSTGNRSVDRRAVLVGDFLEYGERGVVDGVERGIESRIHEGPGGLSVLEDRAASMIDADVLSGQIPDPAMAQQVMICTLGICQPHTLLLSVTDPALSAAEVSLDPRPDGTIRARWRGMDPSLDWIANVSGAFFDYTGTGDIHANYLDVWATLHPAISDGDIVVTVTEVSATTNELVVDTSNLPPIVVDQLPDIQGQVEELVRTSLEQAAMDAVEQQLPVIVGESLVGLSTDRIVDTHGVPIRMQMTPADLVVDDNAITVGVTTHVTAVDWALPEEYSFLGSLYAGYAPPSWSFGGGTKIAVSADFLNQVMLALWGGGLFNLQIDVAELDLSDEEIANLFPGLNQPVLRLEPLMPPVIVPGEDGVALGLQLGDYRLSVTEGVGDTASTAMQAYLTAFMDMNVAMDENGQVVLELDDIEPHVDIVLPADEWERQEPFVASYMTFLRDQLQEQLGTIPMPTIEGTTLTIADIDQAGSDNGYILFAGDMSY